MTTILVLIVSSVITLVILLQNFLREDVPHCGLYTNKGGYEVYGEQGQTEEGC
jgi:hypothetical protein